MLSKALSAVPVVLPLNVTAWKVLLCVFLSFTHFCPWLYSIVYLSILILHLPSSINLNHALNCVYLSQLCRRWLHTHATFFKEQRFMRLVARKFQVHVTDVELARFSDWSRLPLFPEIWHEQRPKPLRPMYLFYLGLKER